MARLLRELATSGVMQTYIAQILDAFAASQPPRTVDQYKLIEPLTERELEILSMLDQRLSLQRMRHATCGIAQYRSRNMR